MKKAITISLFILLSLPNVVIAQTGKIWCFGDSTGLNFNYSPPIPISTRISSIEAAASICDNSGNLLFYTGGYNQASLSYKVWDRNSNVMPNGDSIFGYSSSTNGVTIIPFPSEPNKYYIFSTDGSGPTYLYYSIVDMNLNGSLGAVTMKNQLLLSNTMPEKLAAVKHANGRDWWLVSHLWDPFTLSSHTQIFVKYLITPVGINGPYYQAIGTDWLQQTGASGEITFNESGDKLVVAGVKLLSLQPTTEAGALLDLFDFDRCTGELSNWQDLGDTTNTMNGWYGCSFSPDGTKLYVSNFNELYQYNLNASNIPASRTFIWGISNNHNWIGQHQIGPNGKIYIAVAYSIMSFPGNTDYDFTNTHLSYIDNPNALGTACNFQPYNIYLNGKRSFASLPNNPNYGLGKLTGSICDTIPIELLIPNVFTPNGDGINDLFKIEAAGTSSLECTIYNRWGIKIAEVNSSTGYVWDGRTTSGIDAVQGVYYYIMNATGVDGQEHQQKGFVHLLR